MFFLLLSLVLSVSNKKLDLSKSIQAVIPAVCMIGLVLVGVILHLLTGRHLDDDEPTSEELSDNKEEEENETSKKGDESIEIAEL